MKIPYIKLYTADLLAASRNVTSEQLGDAILAACEIAFENDTAYQPETTREKTLFTLLTQWKDESKTAWKQQRKIAKAAAQARWKKQPLSDGASSIPAPDATAQCHTETETETKTETETETETENINTSTAPTQPAQEESLFQLPKKLPNKTKLQQFSNQVLEQFESTVQTREQKGIWFRRNCRCLSDILGFCNQDITLALQTIRVCILRLKKAGFSGGYEAVCRNLPEYAAQAQKELEGEYGFTQ